MAGSCFLRQMTSADYSLVREIYAEAIESQGPACYSIEQIEAWSGLAWLPGVLDKPLHYGRGWLSFAQKEVSFCG